YEWIGEAVFADSRQLSKALVRGRLGPSREAQPSDLLRGQVPAHRQHRQELLIAILKPIAVERLTALRRLIFRYGFACVHQVSTSPRLNQHRLSPTATPHPLSPVPLRVFDHRIWSAPSLSLVRLSGPG